MGRRARLDIGPVLDVAEVVANSVALGRRLWEPSEFDLDDTLVSGANPLEVTVTNTRANQFVHTDEISRRLVDNLIGMYHQQCLALERNCTASGLYGPVSIT